MRNAIAEWSDNVISLVRVPGVNPYMRGIEAIEEIIEDLNTLTLDTEKKAEYIERLLLLRDMCHQWRQEEMKKAM